MYKDGTYQIVLSPEVVAFFRNRYEKFPRKWWRLYSYDKEDRADSILLFVEALCQAYGVPVCRAEYSNKKDENGQRLNGSYDPQTETLQFRTSCAWTTVLEGFYKYLADKYAKCGKPYYNADEPSNEGLHESYVNKCVIFADTYYELLKKEVIGATRTDLVPKKQRRNAPVKRKAAKKAAAAKQQPQERSFVEALFAED
jgi:hypothetical protein